MRRVFGPLIPTESLHFPTSQKVTCESDASEWLLPEHAARQSLLNHSFNLGLSTSPCMMCYVWPDCPLSVGVTWCCMWCNVNILWCMCPYNLNPQKMFIECVGMSVCYLWAFGVLYCVGEQQTIAYITVVRLMFMKWFIFSFWMNLHTDFHSGCTSLHTTNSGWEFLFTCILASICGHTKTWLKDEAKCGGKP
jgi:hypothetical protein